MVFGRFRRTVSVHVAFSVSTEYAASRNSCLTAPKANVSSFVNFPTRFPPTNNAVSLALNTGLSPDEPLDEPPDSPELPEPLEPLEPPLDCSDDPDDPDEPEEAEELSEELDEELDELDDEPLSFPFAFCEPLTCSCWGWVLMMGRKLLLLSL